jgi:hypothetical protein
MTSNPVIGSPGGKGVSTAAVSDATTLSIPTLQTLLGEVLEVCFHELLYQRELYPHEIFSPQREYLGIRHHVAVNEEISLYIVNTLDVAVPAICSGLADKISFDIVDSQGDLIESYVFDVDSRMLSDGGGCKQHWDAQKVYALEQNFKNLLLKIITLDGLMSALPSDAKFKLRLHTVDNNDPDQQGCRELHHAIKTGTWVRSVEKEVGNQSTAKNNDSLVIRLLKSIHVPESNLRMELTVKFKAPEGD